MAAVVDAGAEDALEEMLGGVFVFAVNAGDNADFLVDDGDGFPNVLDFGENADRAEDFGGVEDVAGADVLNQRKRDVAAFGGKGIGNGDLMANGCAFGNGLGNKAQNTGLLLFRH